MLRLLKIICLTAFILNTNGSSSQKEPEQFDTLYTRGNKMILNPRYDSIEELKQINSNADTILTDLQTIKEKLGLTDKPKKDERH